MAFSNGFTFSPNSAVDKIFDNYPETVKDKMMYLRQLIIDTAKETKEITHLTETLKWGEPSYQTKISSTLRMDWKPKNPNQYAMYFQCTSKLIATFKMVYDDVFTFEGDRAILFQMDDTIPEAALKKCITVALTYHKVKHLPQLSL